MSQVTCTGRAVACTAIPFTSLETVYGPHACGSSGFPTHIHAGRPTAPVPFSATGYGTMPISMPLSCISFTTVWAAWRISPGPACVESIQRVFTG